MLSRRNVGLGLLASLATSVTKHLGSAEQPLEFICGTVDPKPQAISDMAKPPDASAIFEYAGETFQMTDYGTAYFPERWNRGDGLTPDTGIITLGICFVDGREAEHALFKTAANEWLDVHLSKFIAFKFSATREISQIRVSFEESGGNQSEIGRRALNIPIDRKTMNVADLSKRTIMHEMGHALGLRHEHNHFASGIVWNEGAVIADMGRPPYGWTDEQTRANILTRYTEAVNCVGSPQFDRMSVMLYPIPRHWTQNAVSFSRNTEISAEDRACVKGLYSL